MVSDRASPSAISLIEQPGQTSPGDQHNVALELSKDPDTSSTYKQESDPFSNSHLMAAGPSARQQPPGRAEVTTPDSQSQTPHDLVQDKNDNSEKSSTTTSGDLLSFDWDEFEHRFEQALSAANDHERALLDEFEELVKYFNIWATAAAAHDNERGTKRLQTRERYVKIAEQSLAQKKRHYTEVVRAFQGALALLSQS